MLAQYPMSTVPNLQGFPEAGYPASSFYGIDSTLAGINAMGASSGSLSTLNAPAQQPNMRTLVVALVIVVASVWLWHAYMK
jgi:hypothetical protein